MNTLPELTLLTDAVRELARQYPNRVVRNSDNHCYYVGPDDLSKGSCIVGHAFIGIGWTTDWNEVHPAHGVAFNQTPIGDIYASLNFPDDDTTYDEVNFLVEWLMNVQMYQDQGAPWAVAIDRADDVMADLMVYRITRNAVSA